MTQPKQKLELTWIGKEQRPRLEPRILIEEPEKSYHARHRVSEEDRFDNRLIFGDNLLALKALEQEFAGKGSVSILIHRITPVVHLSITTMESNTHYGYR